MEHKDKKGNLVLFATRCLAHLLLVSSSLAVVSGQQLLSDLIQPVYQVENGDELDSSRDPIATYLMLPDQSAASMIAAGGPQQQQQLLFGYQSPELVNEAILHEQLLEKLDELKRRARLDGAKSASGQQQAELIDILRDIEGEERLPAAADELKISPPINNPLEFEAAAKILKRLPQLAPHHHQNHSSSSPSDLVSLDTLLSLYLNNLAKEMHDDAPKSISSSSSSSSSTTSTDDIDSNNNIVSEQQPRGKPDEDQQQEDTKAPASRYGSAEYIDHPLAIIGHQYVQGGAGEGKQLLGPDGTFENVQVVKTDHAVPSYCDPPNPCPIGFTAEDGCLENFKNSASSSREYQAKQQCSCDNEHSLFNCASPVSTLRGDLYTTQVTPAESDTSNNPHHQQHQQSANKGENDQEEDDNRIDQQLQPQQQESNGRLDTLARTIQNRFGSLTSVQNLISRHDYQTDGNALLD